MQPCVCGASELSISTDAHRLGMSGSGQFGGGPGQGGNAEEGMLCCAEGAVMSRVVDYGSNELCRRVLEFGRWIQDAQSRV